MGDLLGNAVRFGVANDVLAAGEGIKKVAKALGVGNGTVSRVKAEMAA